MEITSCIWPPKRDGYGPHLMTLQPAPEELNIRRRVPTGETVPDPDSVYDDDSGRSFHGYKFGKYYLPNDGVSLPAGAVRSSMDGQWLNPSAALPD